MRRLVLPFVIALGLTVLAAQAWAATGRAVKLHDDYITMRYYSAPHGEVRFNVSNVGLHVHNFKIKRLSTGVVIGSTRDIAPGSFKSITRTLPTGRYKLFCSHHVAIGMYVFFKAT